GEDDHVDQSCARPDSLRGQTIAGPPRREARVASRLARPRARSPGKLTTRYGTTATYGSTRVSVNWPEAVPEAVSVTDPAIVRPLTCPSKLSVFSWNRTASPFTSTRSIMMPGCDSSDIQLPP